MDAIREKNRVELLDLRDSAKKLLVYGRPSHRCCTFLLINLIEFSYEKENRGYQNERDAAVVAREHVETELRDTKERLSDLQASYRMFQVNSENNQSELRSSLKVCTYFVVVLRRWALTLAKFLHFQMKAFEAERTDALLQESQVNI